jgi:lysosomal acid lipase/cholesteryl ester hydrolase
MDNRVEDDSENTRHDKKAPYKRRNYKVSQDE